MVCHGDILVGCFLLLDLDLVPDFEVPVMDLEMSQGLVATTVFLVVNVDV